MADVQLNWAGATVKDAELTVPLEGEIPKGWKGHFETTVRLLGEGDWGNVELKKKKIRVAGVESGEEDKLRFYLEGVVEQANSAESIDEEREHSSGRDHPEAAAEGPDAELTERFRSFAEQREGAASEGAGSEGEDSESE
jgi:hypothetical protein